MGLEEAVSQCAYKPTILCESQVLRGLPTGAGCLVDYHEFRQEEERIGVPGPSEYKSNIRTEVSELLENMFWVRRMVWTNLLHIYMLEELGKADVSMHLKRQL